jgi:hypothetical protein
VELPQLEWWLTPPGFTFGNHDIKGDAKWLTEL